MNIAVGEGIQFGKDLIFTFGPLAAVYTRQYTPATDTMMLIASTVIIISLFLCCATALRGRKILLLGFPILVSQCYQPDPILLGLPFFILVAILLGDRKQRLQFQSMALIGAAAMALLPLVKGSTTPSIAVFGTASLIALARKSRSLAAWSVVLFVGSMLSAWTISGQSVANLPSYFINQMPIISGYANAMSSKAGPYELIGFLVCALLLIVATYRFIDRSRLVITMMTAFYMFLCLKAGFIRGGDGHVLEAAFALILFSYFLSLYRPGKESAALFAVCLTVWWITNNGHIDVSPITMAGRFFGAIRASVHGIHSRLVSGRKEFNADLANAKRKIREEVQFPKTPGDADVYSVNLSNLFANDIKWKPRPIPQSYSVYTPALVKLNNEHLRYDGPSRVFFRLFPIDGRYPTMEDGASWLTLMSHYQPAGIVKSFAYFDRAQMVHAVSLDGPIGPGILKLGTDYPLPHDAPLFVKIDIQPTFIGKLLSFAYKTPQLHLVATYADGRSVTYRYIPGMGQTGFVLSPTVSTATEFFALQSPNWKEYLGAKMPLSIDIRGDSGTSLAWKLEAPIQLYRIKVPTYASVDSMLFQAPTRVASVYGFLPTPDCNIDHINDVDPGTKPLKTASNILHIEGWAMISSKTGQQNDKVSIALVYPDGHALVYPSNKTDRQDVGVFFHHPDVKMVGYDALINIRDTPRPFAIRIMQTSKLKTYICDRAIQLE